MKILQVVLGFPPESRAGTELYTYGLAKELGRNNEVHVFYPRWHGPREYHRDLHIVEHAAKIGRSRLYFSALNLLSLKHTYKNIEVEREFEALLNEINPDIVHFQHLLNLSASLIEIVKSRGLPVIVNLHDFWFICLRSNLLKSDYSVCKGPDIRSENCFKCYNRGRAESFTEYLVKYRVPRNLSKVYELSFMTMTNSTNFEQRQEYMKSLLLMVDKLIAPSMFLKNVFIENGIPEGRIVYSSNGYDLSVFEGFKKKEKDRMVFGFAGHVARHKGVHVLIEAFNRVKSDNVKLRIYGTYEPESNYFRELQSMIRNDNIEFMGRYTDVREPYSEIEILIVPSICYESFSLVVQEAFITHTPVIASAIGALPEFVEDNKTGMLFRPGDSDDLCEKIKTLIENPGLIKKFQANIGPVKTMAGQVAELEVIYRTASQKKFMPNPTVE